MIQKPKINSIFFTLVLCVLCLLPVNVWAYEGAPTYVDGVWYVLDESAEKSIFQTGSYTYNLAGPGEHLTFDAKRDYLAIQNLKVNDGYSDIFDVYVGQVNWGTIEYVSYPTSGTLDVNVNSQSITFSGATAATLKRYFKNVKVTMAKYIKNPSESALDFGTNINVYKPVVQRTFTIDWCNADALTYTLSGGSSSQYTVSIDNNSSAGHFGTATFTVTYNHTAEGTHNETLTITGEGAYSKIITLSGSATDNETPVYTWNGADTYYVDDAAIDLNALWTSTSNAPKSYNIVSFTPLAGAVHDGAIEPALIGTMLSIGQAGTLELSIAQNPISGYLAGDDTKTIIISKRTPEFTWNTPAHYYYGDVIDNIFTSSNTDFDCSIVSGKEYVANVNGNVTSATSLSVHAVDETTTITIDQVENYKWNSQHGVYSVTPEPKPNHVPFKVKDIRTSVQYDASNWGSEVIWVDGDKGYRLGKGLWNESDNYIAFSFTGIPDKLKFDVHLEDIATILPATPISILAESTNGIEWDTTWISTNRVSDESHEIQLKSNTHYIKLSYNGTIYAHFNNIEITELILFDADVEGDVLDFGLQGVHFGVQTKTFNFDHANAGRITSVILSGADKEYYSVVPTSITGTGRDMYGSRTLQVSFDNKNTTRPESQSFNATLTISDDKSHTEIVTLTGKRFGKNVPELTFNPNHIPYYFGTTIIVPVVSTNNQTKLVLTSLDPDIATIEDGHLVIGNTAGEAHIQAYQAETTDYREHTQIFTITTRPKPNLSVPFMMEESIYTNDVIKGAECNWQSDECIRTGLSDWTATASGRYWTDGKRFTIEFGGTPDKVSFKAKNTYCAIVCRWKVEESSDGEYWTEVFYKRQSCKDWITFSDIQLQQTTHFVRFSYGGNYAGYFKDINITALDGVRYLLTPEGKYLSRGGRWGTQAVIDDFGTPLRFTRYTKDNTIDTTLVQFVDSRQYLYEAGDNTVFTDNITAGNSNIRWIQTLGANTISLSNGVNKYITVNSEGKVVLTTVPGDVMVWEIEDYTIYESRITAKINSEAAKAAAKFDFGEDVNTLEKLNSKFEENDFDQSDVAIPHFNNTVYQRNGKDRVAEGIPAVRDTVQTDLQPGLYRLRVQAFYRPSASPVDWDNHAEGMESVIAYIFANGVKSPIKSVYDETGRHSSTIGVGKDTLAGGGYYAADGDAAHYVFSDEQKYVNDVYVYIDADPGKTTGTLNYGIVNPSYVDGEWLAFENITLTCIARKEYIYKTTADTKWDKLSNWEYKGAEPVSTPTINHAIIIKSDMVVDDGELQAYSITIDPGVHITVAPTGGIKVREGGIINATKDNFKLQASTSGANKGQTGYLRISPDYKDPMPQATVELYSIAYFDMNGGKPDNNAGAYQYVGSPLAAGTAAKEVFKSSWIYNWDETSGAWKNNRKTLTLEPFKGYATSQYKDENGILISNKGQLASNSDQLLNLTYTSTSAEPGINVLANSYTAPIDITKFELSDFSDGVEAAIYIFNTGSANDTAAARISGDVNAPGQFLSIPVKTAIPLGYPAVIPSMQGFYVKTAKDGTLTLDYQRLVWEATESNKPLRAPSRQDEETIQTLCVTLSADGWHDNVYLLQSDNYETAFENGYDAHKIMNGNLNIFTIEDENYLSVDATNNIIGTRIGVRTGEETAYTICFGRVSDDKWSLYDAETGNNVAISDGAQYTFFAEPNTVLTNRFYIIERVGVCTGINETQIDNSARKFIKEGQLFILKNGVLYNTMGNLVRE